jgi:hypothetical protein
MAQVNMPQSRRKDPLETILQGVQLASGILGIKDSLNKSDLMNKQAAQSDAEFQQKQAEQTRITEGRLTPAEELQVSKGFQMVPEGTAGAVKFISPTTGAPAFYSPRQEGVSPLEIAKLDLEKKKVGLQQQQLSQNRTDKEREQADTINKEFINNGRTNEYVKAYEKAGNLQNLLMKKQSVIDAIALRQVFGLSGDTGAIRAEDLEQFSTNPALLDRFVAIFNKGLDGQVIPDNERKYLMDFAADMNANARVKLMKHADTFASRLSNTTKYNKKEALEYLNPSNLLTDVAPRNVPQGIPERQIGIGEAGAAKKRTNEDIMNEFISQ